MVRPGLLVLIGSGETTSVGGQVFDAVAGRCQLPVKIGILETPAGFELNSAQVAGRVRNYLVTHLQNIQPDIQVIPARKKATDFSPDDPDLARGIISSGVLFAGPGSPSYAVRQLSGTIVWQTLQACYRMGMPLILASAAAIAIGQMALPVYEIFKVGEESHWIEGLNLLGYLGLNLVVVPHWNNGEGGTELDTRRCFMGIERFKRLTALLDSTVTILGIDENTAILIDFQEEVCHVMGRENVTILKGGQERIYSRGETFPLNILGNYLWPEMPDSGIPVQVWDQVHTAYQAKQTRTGQPVEIPGRVQDLVTQRQKARSAADWRMADQLRVEIQELGWRVTDTPHGPLIQKNEADQFTRIPRTQSPTNQ